jgi:hypothetical protein
MSANVETKEEDTGDARTSLSSRPDASGFSAAPAERVGRSFPLHAWSTWSSHSAI